MVSSWEYANEYKSLIGVKSISSAINMRSLNLVSTGPDSIPSQLLKVDEPELVKALHKIRVNIWETEKIPIEWEEGSTCPIFKKGDQLECRNYRGITLLNTAYKIFSNLLIARLQPYTDKVIGNYQCGFRPQRSTIDQIHTLKQILEKNKEYNIKTFHLFVDFKAAYDSINRYKMIEAMTEFKEPKKLVNLTKATLKNKEPQVTQVIRSNRLRWLGHIWRSPETTRPGLTHLRILWDLEQEEDHQQGG
ncbi:reverse transcriptase domain-containing protein [Trichonephila clavipes]|nr:reverse transcriptase domain-containing protein [Trichonephila clavipes]